MMISHFFNPAAQRIVSAGSVLRKNILKKINTVNRYTFLPIEKKFEKLLRLVNGSPCILLDQDGTILSWNKTFEKLKGYREKEIIGQNFNIFYLPLDRQTHLPEQLLRQAAEKGRAQHLAKRVRKDGTTFWGNIIITAIRNPYGDVLGFTETTELIPEQEND